MIRCASVRASEPIRLVENTALRDLCGVVSCYPRLSKSYHHNLSYSIRKRTPEKSQTNKQTNKRTSTHTSRVSSTPQHAHGYRGRSVCDPQTCLLLDSEASVDKAPSIDRTKKSQCNDQMGETYILSRRDSTGTMMHMGANRNRKVPNSMRGPKAKTLGSAV